MIVARDVAELPRASARAVAIGSFDGVHLGHREVIRSVVESRIRSTVITFDPHPRQVLGRGVDLISTLERRLELIAEAGADEVLVQEFTLGLAGLEAERWVETILQPLGAQEIVVGDNFRFGRGRAGDVALLRAMGYSVRATPLVGDISSTCIRRLLRAGDIAEASSRLGRPPELEGLLVHPYLERVLLDGWDRPEGVPASAAHRADVSELPTALLSVGPTDLLPAAGVYEASIVDRPALLSVDDRAGACSGRRVELWSAGVNDDLLGARVRVRLERRLPGYWAAPHEQALVDLAGAAT